MCSPFFGLWLPLLAVYVCFDVTPVHLYNLFPSPPLFSPLLPSPLSPFYPPYSHTLPPCLLSLLSSLSSVSYTPVVTCSRVGVSPPPSSWPSSISSKDWPTIKKLPTVATPFFVPRGHVDLVPLGDKNPEVLCPGTIFFSP